MKNLSNNKWSKIGTSIFNKSIVMPLLITYVVMILVFLSINKDYLSLVNIKNILINLTIPGIMAVGLTFVIIAGNVDISIGSILGVTAMLVNKLYNIEGVNIPIVLVILIGLSVGLIIGALNGFIVTVIGVNSIITTLGTLAVFRGLMYVWFTGTSKISYRPFISIARTYVFKHIPITLIYFLVILAAGYFVLRFTKFGKDTYSTGANYFVSRLYGVNVKRVQFISFLISGLTASIGGILMVSFLAYADGTFGKGFEFKILTACLLGGISLSGGRGTLVGVLVATFLLGSISSGLVMVDVSPNYRELFSGLILIAAIFFDARRAKSPYQIED